VWVILSLLAIASGTVLAVVVVVKVKEARESRERRTVATPYGVMMGPTNGELRRTREIHLPTVEVTDRKCLDCGRLNFFDEDPVSFVATCRQCGREHRLV
jgi:hypothetical protein